MLTKKFFLIIIAVFALTLPGWTAASFAKHELAPVSDNTRMNEIKFRIAQMKFYSGLTLKDYENLQGRRLNFFEKFSFKISQHRMRKMLKAYDKEQVVSVLQKISWLFKGILLGPIALLLGYIFLKGDERELIKWIWFGFAGWVVIIVAILVSV